MMQSKQQSDVRGVKIGCPMYEHCPLCYGCRAFDPKYEECRQCEFENSKKNICKTERHKPELLAKMITRPRIEV